MGSPRRECAEWGIDTEGPPLSATGSSVAWIPGVGNDCPAAD